MASHPAQKQLRNYLHDNQFLLAASQVTGPWALRLDVGMPADRDLLDMYEADNFLRPLAGHLSDYRLADPGLVSAWYTKQHITQSAVRIEPATRAPEPPTGTLKATTTPPAADYQKQVRAAVAEATELPPGPVRLELAFVVGPGRNWLNLWKETIDALDPLLGRTQPDRDWHPLDGRITELGMHLRVNPVARQDITVEIAASAASAVG